MYFFYGTSYTRCALLRAAVVVFYKPGSYEILIIFVVVVRLILRINNINCTKYNTRSGLLDRNFYIFMKIIITRHPVFRTAVRLMQRGSYRTSYVDFIFFNRILIFFKNTFCIFFFHINIKKNLYNNIIMFLSVNILDPIYFI